MSTNPFDLNLFKNKQNPGNYSVSVAFYIEHHSVIPNWKSFWIILPQIMIGFPISFFACNEPSI